MNQQKVQVGKGQAIWEGYEKTSRKIGDKSEIKLTTLKEKNTKKNKKKINQQVDKKKKMQTSTKML